MARSVPLSRSTLRVGGGSAFFVQHDYAHNATDDHFISGGAHGELP
jgi:hypothetical protein